jgi:hypothetical protein
VLVLVLAHRRRQRLIQVRQRVVAQVKQLELGDATSWTHMATCSPLRLGRVLPRMMPILTMADSPVLVR